MGWLGKSFCFSVLFEIPSITGNEAKIIVLCKSGVRATPVSATFFKSRSQKLKMLTFASCCALARPQRRTAGIQRALSPLARFFRHFLPRSKKWHQNCTAHAHEVQCERQKKKLPKI